MENCIGLDTNLRDKSSFNRMNDNFSDIDLPALIKEFYSNFLHYDLTDDEVNTIITSSGLK